MAHQHTAGKGSARLVVEHIFIEFVARAMTHLVVDERIVVHHLVFVGNHTTIAEALGSLALEHEVEAVAGDSVVEGNHVVVHTAVGLLFYIDIAHTAVLDVGLLQAIEVETGILAHESLDNLGGEEVAVVGSMVAEEELCLSSLLQHDEHTAVYHQIDVGAQDVDNLNGALHLHVLGHIDEQAVLRQECVQGRNAVLVGLGNLGVVFPDEFGLFCGYLAQRAYDYALGKVYLGQRLVVESIVDHKIERGAEIGHVATESLIGVDGNFQTVQVQAIVGLEDGFHVCILVSLYLAGGEAQAAEVFEGSVAHCIENPGTVLLDHSRRRLIQL